MKRFKHTMMRDFGLTSAEADNAFEIAQGEVLHDIAQHDAMHEGELREVLEYVLEAEKGSFEEHIESHGEEWAIENHIWSKAINVFLDFGFNDET